MNLSVKLINGILKRIDRVIYPSTGTVVERTLPMDSDIPEEVEVVKEPHWFETKCHIPAEPIHNMEYALYAHYVKNNQM